MPSPRPSPGRARPCAGGRVARRRRARRLPRGSAAPAAPGAAAGVPQAPGCATRPASSRRRPSPSRPSRRSRRRLPRRPGLGAAGVRRSRPRPRPVLEPHRRLPHPQAQGVALPDARAGPRRAGGGLARQRGAEDAAQGNHAAADGAFAKHKEPYAALNPNVRVTYRPDPFPAKPLTRLLEEVLATVKGVYKDAKVTGKPAAPSWPGTRPPRRGSSTRSRRRRSPRGRGAARRRAQGTRLLHHRDDRPAVGPQPVRGRVRRGPRQHPDGVTAQTTSRMV